MLGESVAAVAHGVHDASGRPAPSSPPLVGFVLAAALWWSWFDLAGAAAKHLLDEAGDTGSTPPHDVYVYGQLPLVLSLAAVGVGVQGTWSRARREAGTRQCGRCCRAASRSTCSRSRRPTPAWPGGPAAAGGGPGSRPRSRSADVLLDVPALVVVAVLAVLLVAVVVVGLEQRGARQRGAGRGLTASSTTGASAAGVTGRRRAGRLADSLTAAHDGTRERG